jgi:hypothetical protein
MYGEGLEWCLMSDVDPCCEENSCAADGQNS